MGRMLGLGFTLARWGIKHTYIHTHTHTHTHTYIHTNIHTYIHTPVYLSRDDSVWQYVAKAILVGPPAVPEPHGEVLVADT